MVDANKYEADHFSRNLFKLSLSLSDQAKLIAVRYEVCLHQECVLCCVCVYGLSSGRGGSGFGIMLSIYAYSNHGTQSGICFIELWSRLQAEINCISGERNNNHCYLSFLLSSGDATFPKRISGMSDRRTHMLTHTYTNNQHQQNHFHIYQNPSYTDLNRSIDAIYFLSIFLLYKEKK